MMRVLPGEDERVASFESDADGHWQFEFLGDQYYVVAVRQVFERTGHHHVCRSDRSPTV